MIPYNQVTKGMYYTTDGLIARVQISKAGYAYAKVLDLNDWQFKYRQGAVNRLDRKMEFEEVLKIGKETGNCCVCARELTNKKSIELGIGPICRGYF